jgi:TonB family protein
METQDVNGEEGKGGGAAPQVLPRLLINWDTAEDLRRSGKAGVGSVLTHIAVLALLPLIPAAPPARRPEFRTVVPLVAPAREPTQKDPNQGKISKEFDSKFVIPRPNIQVPPSPPSTTRPAALREAPPTVAPPAPKPFTPPPAPEPPRIELAEAKAPPLPGPLQPNPVAAPPPQQIQVEQPKLAFETPGGVPETPRQQGLGRAPVAAPAPGSGAIQEAVRNLARGAPSGGLTVGDTGPGGIGGLGEGVNLPPSPGKSASKLELLSDPMGVDFRPYLLRILATVRRNWFAVIPEGVRLGQKGTVAIQFAISKDGRVPKLVIAGSSGFESLDRAAVAGISASNPFPALPAEFKGGQIRLQFVFQYNAAVR